MSEKEHKEQFHIKVNTREKTVDSPLTYAQIVELAFPGEQNSNEFDYKISYVAPHMPDGTVAPEGSIKIENGMKFVVGKSNRS